MVVTICRQKATKLAASVGIGDGPREPVAVEFPPQAQNGVGLVVAHEVLPEDGEVLVVGTGGTLGQGAHPGENGDADGPGDTAWSSTP